MGRKWRRSRLSLTTGFMLSALIASQAAAEHGPVELKTVDGKLVTETFNENKTVEVTTDNGTVTLVKGEPVSFEKTCSSCHQHEGIIEDIRASHHGAVGLHDMGWMDNPETRGDDTGTKDFVTNVVLRMRYFRTKSHYGGW